MSINHFAGKIITGAILFIWLLFSITVNAATITVNTFDDLGPVTGLCTLRQALQAVTSNPGETGDCPSTDDAINTVVLPPGTYKIRSDSEFEGSRLGGLIRSGTIITGDRAANTIIDFQLNQSSLFVSYSVWLGPPTLPILERPLVTVRNVTVRNSRHPNGAIQAAPGSRLAVVNSVIQNNQASSATFEVTYAGGITASSHPAADATHLTIIDTLIEGNSSSVGPGGVACLESTPCKIINSTIRNNTSTATGSLGGGGIYNKGSLSLVNTTISGNASAGGGGGGIYNEGSASVFSNTIILNSASSGASGGIRNNGLGSLYVANSIIAQNTGGSAPDLNGEAYSLGYNILGECGSFCSFYSETGDQVGAPANKINPQLAQTLSTLGGTLPVHRPLTGSPAIDQGNPGPFWTSANNSPAFDARGIARGVDGNGDGIARGDIGAVEVGRALLVRNAPAVAGDTALLNRLQNNLGFFVNALDDDGITTAAANGTNMVVISDSVTSTKINAAFRDVTQGVALTEAALLDDMGMTGNGTGNNGATGSQTAQSLINPTHPLSAGLTGSVTVTSSPQTFIWGLAPVPTPSGLIRIANHSGNSNNMGIFAYDRGTTTADSSLLAPGKRVGFFASTGAFNALNTNGQRLFDAAINWGARAPITIEAEAMGRSPSASPTNNSAASGGQWVNYPATAVGNAITFTDFYQTAPFGNYKVQLRVRACSSCGIAKLEVRQGLNNVFVNLGTFDFYSATAQFRTVTSNTTMLLDKETDVLFRLTVTGKNGSSSSYAIPLDAVIVTPL